jgi:hypothetical protein
MSKYSAVGMGVVLRTSVTLPAVTGHQDGAPERGGVFNIYIVGHIQTQ